MRRDPTEFRERFKRWKAGERVYNSGWILPTYDDGTTPGDPPGGAQDELDVIENQIASQAPVYYTGSEFSKMAEQRPDFMEGASPYDKTFLDKEEGELLNEAKPFPDYFNWLVNYYNKGLHQGRFLLNAGMLPQVTITPSEFDKLQMRNMKGMFWSPIMRVLMYNYLEGLDKERSIDPNYHPISVNDRINNLANVYLKSGSPHFGGPGPSSWFIKMPDGSPRAYYYPDNNTIYNIPATSPYTFGHYYLSELAHAYQYNAPNNHGLATFGLPGDTEWFNAGGYNGGDYYFGKYIPYTTYRRSNGYDRPGHKEFNAHSIILPAIIDYITYSQGRDDVDDYVVDQLKRTKEEVDAQYEDLPDDSEKEGIGDRRFDIDENGNAVFRHTFDFGKSPLRIPKFDTGVSPDDPPAMKTLDQWVNGDAAYIGNNTYTDQCAQFANALLNNLGYNTSGNAWNPNQRSLVYSGYDVLNRPLKYDRAAVEAYNHAATKKFYDEFDSKTLDQSKVYTVNMFYNGSSQLQNAYNEARDGVAGSHTGVVRYNKKDKDWEVVHNIHGKVYVDKFTKIQDPNAKYGITAIYEPRSNNAWNNAWGSLMHLFGGGYDFGRSPKIIKHL